MSRHRVFLPSVRLAKGEALLTPEARHHLVEVLRLKAGDAVEIFDGEGGSWEGNLGTDLEKVVLGARHVVPAPEVKIHLLVALAKGEKMDLVVQKTTELGVSFIAPFEAERSVVRLSGDRGTERASRWRRIAEEAARQCGRAEVPAVLAPQTLDRALEAVPAGHAIHVFHTLLPEPGSAERRAHPSGVRGHALVVGPEGGLTDAEYELCLRAGAHPASLGPRILRAETAAIVAVALVQTLRGDMAGGFLDPVQSGS